MNPTLVTTQSTLTKEEVKNLLSLTFDEVSYAQLFYDILANSIHKYNIKYSSDRQLHGKTTKANIIHDYIKSEIISLALEDNNVRIHKQNGMFTLILKNRVILRFKKLNSEKKSCNVPTKQVESFRNQDLEITGTEQSIVRLDAGYLLDGFGRDLKGVYFVKANTKTSIGWRISAELELSVNDQIPLFKFEETNFEDVLTIKPHLRTNELNKTAS
jgi:hypothetical protein